MKNRFLLIWLHIGMLSCCLQGIDNKMTPEVSESIAESKELGVFLDEYEVRDITILDSTYNFPIKGAWTEKIWYYGIDSITCKEILVIKQNLKGKIVWELYNNDTIFSALKYTYKWIVLDAEKCSTGTMGSSRRRTVLSNIPDSLLIKDNEYTIYKLNSNHVFDTIANSALFKFRLREK